jgi:predicted methyltransferase
VRLRVCDPADTHDVVVFSPKIRGRPDQFVFRLRKPVAAN